MPHATPNATRRLLSMFLAVGLVFSGATIAAAPAEAKVNTSLVEGRDKAAKLFNPLDPVRIDMTIPTDTWNFIQNDIYTTSYKRAFLTLTKDGKVISNPFNVANPSQWEVGIRLKGRASRRDLTAKAPFKIKLDKFVEGQNLWGLSKLTLNNMVQDPSMVRESVVYRLFRNVGVPAPRTGFAEVYVTSPGQVTNAYYGLYLNIETPDEAMLKRWFGNKTAHLYESAYDTDVTNDYYHQYLDSIDVGDEEDVSDLLNILPISDLTGEAWWESVQSHADMNEILALMAVDIFVSNWDGYTDFVRNNHYAHFDLDGTLRIMPWGNDQVYPDNSAFFFAFDGSNSDPRGWSNVRSIMYRRCVTIPECNYELMTAVDKVSSSTSKLKLAKQVNDMVSVINDAVEADERKEISVEYFTEQHEYVESYQGDRIDEWNEWKTRLIPASPEVELSCAGRRCTFDVSQPNSSDQFAEVNQVQELVGSKWVTLIKTPRETFSVKTLRTPRIFRVRSSNHFGTSEWHSATTL